MRFSLFICGALLVSACQPIMPDSAPRELPQRGTGVGLGNPASDQARAAREAELSGTSTQRELPRAIDDPAGLDRELAQNTAPAQTDVINASPSNAAPVLISNPGISDENSFDAVASRESIESDAARLEANRAQYEVIAPTALPTREGSGPNIVAFALGTSHPKGVKVYRRFGLTTAARHQRSCQAFRGHNDAQAAFLDAGGPNRDRLGLDPDGDGYACEWDPTPFRAAARG